MRRERCIGIAAGATASSLIARLRANAFHGIT
ncbi:hypothetical protein PMO31116_01339 [Pandoraea morbifera]|uniref:Uncharacterized protein n=1 Tax=Pandoraea morbifera TaxID=2508300 RepID=A0A5E4TCQ6_9BURK|nr:hypothetical protein PMO31116_01339 [Pandoraea morbifera]